uniref:Uncharacterized protein n=1 Tax=Nicotiana tabacum TaxID=4097 RepID=A0A1S3ZJN4_TOBAC|nr:PREDICTED: uncharacterized protein LOC107787489 [Nicotiana tabacum]XP_016464556.1 PREDICTED: uncharacterized protein LOC107787489 [Nicotiana tabacum]
MIRITLKPKHMMVNLMSRIVLLVAFRFNIMTIQRRTQTNRNNRAKQTRPRARGSKSIATLMNEQVVNGKEPTQAGIFILTHKNVRMVDQWMMILPRQSYKYGSQQ